MGLALQACDKLGKGSRAVRVYERATKDLRPPLEARGAGGVGAARLLPRGGARDGLALCAGALDAAGGGGGGAEGPRREGGAVDLPTLNMAVSTLAKAGLGDEAVAALDGMRAGRWGVAPDVVTYGAAVEGLLVQLQQQQEQPSPPSPSSAGPGTETGLDAALALLERMQAQDSLEPNAVIRTMLAQACCRAGRAPEALALLQAIPERHRDLHRVRPLWALATRAGHAAALEWLMADLERRGAGDTLAPTAYHAALCNLARLGLVRPAERLAAAGRPRAAAAAAAAQWRRRRGRTRGTRRCCCCPRCRRRP